MSVAPSVERRVLDLEDPARIVYLAALIAVEAPDRFKAGQSTTYLRAAIVEELRRELLARGFDWAQAHRRMRSEATLRRSR